jgi:chromosome segregation ATPase
MPMIILFLVLFSVLGGVGYGGYSYYQDTQARLIQYAENQSKLEDAIATSEATIGRMNDNIEKQQKLNTELQSNLNRATKQQDKLRQVLSKRDLSKQALTDPAQLEERMNNATSKVWARIESLSGNDARQRLLDQKKSDAGKDSDKDGVHGAKDSTSSPSKTD